MKNITHTATLSLTNPDRPMPETWRRAAAHIVHSKVRPVLRSLSEGQSMVVPCERPKSPQLEVKRLASNSSPWLARVRLNTETVLFVARHTLRLVHGDTTYHGAY